MLYWNQTEAHPLQRESPDRRRCANDEGQAAQPIRSSDRADSWFALADQAKRSLKRSSLIPPAIQESHDKRRRLAREPGGKAEDGLEGVRREQSIHIRETPIYNRGLFAYVGLCPTEREPRCEQ